MRLTAKQKRRAQLLSWRFEQYAEISARELAESFEAIQRYELPSWLDKALTEFRHLRSDARIAACRAFLAG